MNFPLPSPTLYRNESSGGGILALAHHPLTPWRLAAAVRLLPRERVARMLRLHRLAIEAELEGVWDRADSLWRDAADALEKLWPDAAAWTELATPAQVKDRAGWKGVREQVAVELFAKTHRALFACYHHSEVPPDHRAFVHVGYATRLLQLAEISGDRLRPLLAPMLEWRIVAYRKAGQFGNAAGTALALAKRFPVDLEYQDRLAEVELELAVAELTADSDENANWREARRLRTIIDRVEHHRQEFPENDSFFDVLAILYRLYAVKLANSGRLSEALGAVEAAHTFNTEDKDIRKLREDLEKAMHQKKAAAEKLLRDVAMQPNAQLNAEGSRFVADAQAGFQEAESFRRTKRDAILQQRGAVQAAAFLRRIGIASKSARKSDVLDRLRKALGRFLSDPPSRREDVDGAWRKAVGNGVDIIDVDMSAVVASLERRLFGERGDDWQVLETTFSNLPTERKAGQEPFALWLFSRRDLAVKVVGIAAAILFVFATAFNVAVHLGQKARQSTIARMAAASAANDDEQVIRAAETFFDATVGQSDDVREQEALDLYSRAISRWFTEVDDVNTPEARQRLDKYKQALARLDRTEVTQ